MLTGSVLACGDASPDAFVIEGASIASHLAEPARPEAGDDEAAASSPSLAVHEVVQGSRVVVTYRRSAPGALAIADDETFEFITLELPVHVSSALTPETVEVPVQGHVAYTSGSVREPERACYGIAESGEVTLRRVTTVRTAVSVRAAIDPIRESGERCERVDLEREFEATARQIGELSSQQVDLAERR